MDKRATLYQQFDPARPLEADSDLYVDWQRDLNRDDIKQRLANSVSLAGDIAVSRLLTGHRGWPAFPKNLMATKTQQAALSVEKQVELTALCNMLELAGGFTLGFARVNHPKLRARLVEAIRRRLPEKAISELTLDPRSASGVVAQLEEAFGQRKLDGVFLYGLDAMFDLAERQSPAMDVLNLNRNYFGKRFPFPVVFWLPEFAMRELSRQAPDFWAWRSGLTISSAKKATRPQPCAGSIKSPSAQSPCEKSGAGARFSSTCWPNCRRPRGPTAVRWPTPTISLARPTTTKTKRVPPAPILRKRCLFFASSKTAGVRPTPCSSWAAWRAQPATRPG